MQCWWNGERKDLCEIKISSCDEIERNTHCVSFFSCEFCWVFFLFAAVAASVVVVVVDVVIECGEERSERKQFSAARKKCDFYTRDDKNRKLRAKWIMCTAAVKQVDGQTISSHWQVSVFKSIDTHTPIFISCLLCNANKIFCSNLFQCTMLRTATKRIQHRISPHSICAKPCRNTWKWARYWLTVEIHSVCQRYDLIRMKNCFGWEMKG